MNRKSYSLGFTIIELLVATVVFSVIMLVAATAVLQIGKIYYKGLNQIKAQETSRAITEEITRAIQFSNAEVQHTSSGTNSGSLCIGRDRYSYVLEKKLATSGPATQKHVLWADGRIGMPCPAISPSSLETQDNPSTGAPGYEPDYATRELLAENMSLLDFSVTGVGAGPPYRLYRVTITIGVGPIDLIDLPTKTCKQEGGRQFCAISSLTTVVARRLQ